jgi:hypothetical protein
MIRDILKLLGSNEFMVNDEDIQFAKGAYEFPLSFKELRVKQKRRKLIRNGNK